MEFRGSEWGREWPKMLSYIADRYDSGPLKAKDED
jgi:hypothetical protein